MNQPGGATLAQEYSKRVKEKSEYGLRNKMIQMVNLFKHRLVNYLVCLLGCHFIDKAIKRYHGQ